MEKTANPRPVRILFVCHGNICRSPMAEYVMKYLVSQAGLAERFVIDSAAATEDAVGCGVHPGTRGRLARAGIPCGDHRARLLTRADYSRWDYIIGMDRENAADIQYICGKDSEHKIYSLLDFTGIPREVADPWYTHNFDDTFNDIMEGCTALLEKLSVR